MSIMSRTDLMENDEETKTTDDLPRPTPIKVECLPGSGNLGGGSPIVPDSKKDLESSESNAQAASQQSLPSNVHLFFDPGLISEGKSCVQTGVRSLVDVPPGVDAPNIGR
jgi:hypothetical protein